MNSAWSALVIDDDPGIRQSLRLCLEADGARVVVGTPSGALETFDRGRFDVVFLDLWLQADSGLTLLPEMFRRQPGAGIIVITAFATFEAMKLGAVDVETIYQMRVVCQETQEAVIRTVLLRHVNSLPKMTIQKISTQDAEQDGRAAVVADIFSVERDDRAIQELMSRINIEPSVTSASWEKVAS